jgi:type I restriction enzyme S subunit
MAPINHGAHESPLANCNWIGQLPNRWVAARIKYGFRTIGSGTTPPSNQEEFYGGDIPWVNTSELRENTVTHTEKTVTVEALQEFSTLKIYPRNSLLFAMYGATIGRVAILGVDATVNQAVCVLADPVGFNERYVFYGLQASRAIFGSIATGGGQPNLNAEKVREHKLPRPPIDEQIAIAQYLDRETACIDGLIAEKERMLSLLEEKCAALISRLVTGVLDPNTQLKPSGMEWLGDIPEHWVVQPIKYLAIVGNGSTPSVDNVSYWDDEGYPWLNSSVVNESPVTSPSRFVTDIALRECHLPKIQPPAVLVGITGQGKTRGMASMLGIEATINQHLAYIKPYSQKLHPDYLRHLLGHAYTFLRSDSDGAGSTKGAITCEQLANMKICVPPTGEQLEICARIRQSLGVAGPLQSEIQRSLKLLAERRAALITAAVTGQIPTEDLRG